MDNTLVACNGSSKSTILGELKCFAGAAPAGLRQGHLQATGHAIRKLLRKQCQFSEGNMFLSALWKLSRARRLRRSRDGVLRY